MMPENSNSVNGDNEPLRSGEGSDDRLKDASTSDAAAENARESERIQEAARAATPAFQLDEDKLERDAQGRKEREAQSRQPLTTQGDKDELEENFSGSTNLSLDQLKKERDPGGYSPEGPEPETEEKF
jgi:hypothetical protein